MSFGIKVWSATGALTFDSTDRVGGVPAEIVTVTGNATSVVTVTKTYPAFAGSTVRAIMASGADAALTCTAAIDYALGYPRVVFTASFSAATYLWVVFAV